MQNCVWLQNIGTVVDGRKAAYTIIVGLAESGRIRSQR